MTPQLTIEFTPAAQAVLDRYRELPRLALIAIAAGVQYQNGLTVAHIQQVYLSFPKQGPVVNWGLRIQSNRLRNSIRATKPVISGQSVISSIGSNVSYAAVHEFGYDGPQNIPAHTRRVRSRNVVGKVGRKKILLAGGVAFVKAHTRNVHFPARAPIQNGIANRLEDYKQDISGRILTLANGGAL